MTGIARPMTENISIRRPFFYRDKRMVLSFLVSITLACFGYFFEAIFMHLATGVLIDWWYFEFKGVKESEITPQGWFDKVGLNKEKLDHHSTVYMWLRHGAFFVSCMAIVADMYFKFGINFAVTFGAAYYAFRFLSAFFLAYNKMIYPWIGAGTQIRNQKSGKWNQFNNRIKGIDMTDPSNGYSFYNPISPHYIFKRD